MYIIQASIKPSMRRRQRLNNIYYCGLCLHKYQPETTCATESSGWFVFHYVLARSNKNMDLNKNKGCESFIILFLFSSSGNGEYKTWVNDDEDDDCAMARGVYTTTCIHVCNICTYAHVYTALYIQNLFIPQSSPPFVVMCAVR